MALAGILPCMGRIDWLNLMCRDEGLAFGQWNCVSSGITSRKTQCGSSSMNINHKLLIIACGRANSKTNSTY